jgi:dTMP kinase
MLPNNSQKYPLIEYNEFMSQHGKFIVIEGTDGSGKTEQFNRLVLRLPEGFTFKTIDFPQYEEQSSYFVREYLNGRYGALEDEGVGPRRASLFYALDRFDASEKKMKQWLSSGATIIANRYVGSNMGHQGGKILDEKKRKEFFQWLYDLEYGILGVPRPDLNIILHMPAEIAQELVDRKAARGYIGGKKRDLHEGNIEHLRHAEKVYLQIAELFPDDFKVIECAPNGNLLSLEEIHAKVWDVAKKTLDV